VQNAVLTQKTLNYILENINPVDEEVFMDTINWFNKSEDTAKLTASLDSYYNDTKTWLQKLCNALSQGPRKATDALATCFSDESVPDPKSIASVLGEHLKSDNRRARMVLFKKGDEYYLAASELFRNIVSELKPDPNETPLPET